MNYFLDPVELSLASKGLRFANFLIDTILLYLINLFVFVPIFTTLLIQFSTKDGVVSTPELNTTYFLYFIIYMIFFLIFMTIQEYLLDGRTIGKLLTGTKVVTVEGEKPTLLNFLIRSLCRLVPLEQFSFFGETGWHDAWSKTRVVINSDFMLNKIKFNSIDQIGKPE